MISYQVKTAILLLGGGMLVSCAASPRGKMQPGLPATAAPPAPAVSLAAEPEPRTLAEAEALLDKAQADLDRLALYEPPPADAPAAAARRAATAPQEQRQADGAASAGAASNADDPCQTACRAFSSMARASDAVCRLDVEGGKRCERARQMREVASRRVASCGCVQ